MLFTPLVWEPVENLTTSNTPYTYLIGWSWLDAWYYGRRTAKDCHPDEFWVTYFTSSDYVAEFIQQHGNPDIIRIHKTFLDSDYLVRVNKCREQEKRFLRNVDAVIDSRWLNRDYGDRDTTGMTTAKHIVTGEIVLMAVKELHRNEHYVGVNGGITHRTSNCKHCGKSIGINNINLHQNTCKSNPNRIPGPLTGRKLTSKLKICKYCGRTGAKHGISRHENVCVHNPNRIPHTSTGQTYEINSATCQYCGKEGSRSGITRHEVSCPSNPQRKTRKNKPRVSPVNS